MKWQSVVNVLNSDQWKSLGRQLTTGGAMVAVTIGALNVSQAGELVSAITQVGSAAGALAVAVGSLAAVLSTIHGVYKSSRASQQASVIAAGNVVVEPNGSGQLATAKRIVQLPGIARVITTPEVANATPEEPKIVAPK